MISKRILSVCLSFMLFFSGVVYAETGQQNDSEEKKATLQMLDAKSAILMEQSTKKVLYEHMPDEKCKIASVTKTMTMLLIMEAIESGKIKYTDMVTTSDYAASMGGSQVFLEPGEEMTVDDMLKAICVSSGNDAAVAMAEHIGGSEEAFVEMMNKRAEELGAKNTHFINCNGLDETDEHYSSARDVALISCELLKHKDIEKYTTIWMDTLRDGKFGLSNTNKLIRFYKGANGIKTGSTSIAKYCLSASAKRDDMQLVAVVLGAPSTQERFSGATKLLDFGFANYSVADGKTLAGGIDRIKVVGGEEDFVEAEVKDSGNIVVKKGEKDKIKAEKTIEEKIKAPVKAGTKVGELKIILDGKEIGKKDIVAKNDVEKIKIYKMYIKMIKKWLSV